MACTTDFIDFVCSQIEGVGVIRARTNEFASASLEFAILAHWADSACADSHRGHSGKHCRQ